MSGASHEEETRRLLAALAPGLESGLLHLLTCSSCRELAAARLREEPLAAAEPGPDYGSVWGRLSLPPEVLAEGRRRQAEAEKLLNELQTQPPGRRQEVVKETRFQNPDFLELLLEESQAAQVTEPARAEELASLVVAGAPQLADVCSVAAVLARAFCLAGNARRLLGDMAGAEAALLQAVPFLALPEERAAHCRALALLRWEQGRLDEAAALLAHAAKLLAAEGDAEDEGISLALLGLLLTELGEPARALGPLTRGRANQSGGDPRLAVRVGLALALCQADLGQPERALAELADARALYPRMAEPDEVSRSDWWEGRIAARIGKRDEAACRLDAVRKHYLSQARLPEAVLASLDLACLLAQAERQEEIAPLLEDLATNFDGDEALDLALRGFLSFSEEIPQREEDVRESAAIADSFIRQTFRFKGRRVGNLPFA